MSNFSSWKQSKIFDLIIIGIKYCLVQYYDRVRQNVLETGYHVNWAVFKMRVDLRVDGGRVLFQDVCKTLGMTFHDSTVYWLLQKKDTSCYTDQIIFLG